MRMAATVLGVGGGLLTVICTLDVLLSGASGMPLSSSCLLLAAGVGAIVGGVIAGARPLWAASLMAVAVVTVTFVPGTVHDNTVRYGLDAAQVALIAGAVVAWLGHPKATIPTTTEG